MYDKVEHLKNLPTIRLSNIVLENFKSVKYGEITFNCGRKHIPYGTQSDMLGLYGQNGSGKTSLIEAISILKYLISGKAIPDEYADCIDVTEPYSALTFSFDIQYPEGNKYPTNNDIRKVVYSFKLEKVQKTDDEKDNFKIYVDDELNDLMPEMKYRVRVFDEILKVAGTVCGEKTPLKPIFDTSKVGSIGPQTKIKVILGELNEELKIELAVCKRIAEETSKSQIFMNKMMKMYLQKGGYSIYYQIMYELRLFGLRYLHVVDSKSLGLNRLNCLLPIFDGKEIQLFPISKSINVGEDSFEGMKAYFESISTVLTQLVPGLTIRVKELGKVLMPNGEAGYSVDIVAVRDEVEIPLRCESDGVRKLIFTLQHLILVFNQKSTTVVYDEFDEGIFEYLLGEIIQIIQDSGKGQFVFTSHNMRPLEVLKKEFVWFTTTDPKERYIKLTGLGETNNLRRVYYREIAVRENYDNLYNETKHSAIVSALRKAGGN